MIFENVCKTTNLSAGICVCSVLCGRFRTAMHRQTFLNKTKNLLDQSYFLQNNVATN